MHGGVKFYRGAARAARAYVERDRFRADDYYLAEGSAVVDRFVATPDGVEHAGPMTGEWMAWNKAASSVATDATPHDLRHYFASVLIRAGLSVKEIQRLLGHKSAVETLDTYGHLMGDEDDRSRAAIRRELGQVADFLRLRRGPSDKRAGQRPKCGWAGS